MAEEGKVKLSFSDVFVQAQGAFSLRSAVSKKLGLENTFTEKSPENPELKVLLDKCCDPSLNISLECSMSLVDLVQEGKADLKYILTRFLNILPSASNKSSAIQAITCLLTHEVHILGKQNGGYHCPYGMRILPHPFITIITNQPDCSQLIMDQVGLLTNRSYSHKGYNINGVFVMLRPFLAFVLGDPRGLGNHSYKQQLQSCLLETVEMELMCNTEEEQQGHLYQNILKFLVSIMPFYKVDQQSIGNSSILIHQFTKWMLGSIRHSTLSAYISDLMENVVDQLLSLTSAKLHNGFDVMSTLLLLRRVQSQFPKIFAKARTVWALNVLLVESPVLYTYQILSLWRDIVGSSSMDQDIHNASLGAVIPLLQIMSSASHTSTLLFGNSENAKQLASKCFIEVDAFNAHKEIPDSSKTKETMTAGNHSVLSGQWLIKMETCAETVNRILRDDKATITWLSSLQSSLQSCSCVPSYISLILGVLLVKANKVICSEVLRAVKSGAAMTPSQSLWFLPLLLCKLGQESDPDFKLQILYTIPDLATHKITTGPILKTLQSLAVSPSLRSISLRLLLKLWHQQSRVFPHLQKALLTYDQDIKDDEIFMELQIAKAATIRDICKERPSQHGADLLVVLSSLIDKNTQAGHLESDSTSIVVALALQGIKHLCEAEVVDLSTAWRVLAAKLSQDKRPAVVRALCELFGLVPSLPTDTQEYEEFKEEVLIFLWKTIQHEIPTVAGAAFSALSQFDMEDFKLCHIPEEIGNPIKLKLMSSKKATTEEELEALELSVNASKPPGVAFMALLSVVHIETIAEFQTFLTSLIRQESSSIPRGVVHNATRANQSCDRSLTGIPSFLEAQYEKSKTPGLNTGLAVGLLFCYEPPFEEHEGKRARRYHLNCARSYKHMLDSLLHEVPMQPSEWHRNLLLPQAWTLFMIRLYHACVLGRKEEIAMQYSRGHIKDKSEVDDKQNNAWLWTRNTFTEQLQSASRGNPSVQGNSVLALAGLAVAVSIYVSAQSSDNQSDGSDGNDERHRTREWLCMVADTLMVVLDGNYKARTAPLTWCQQVSSPNSTASSLLARACAALSLSQMVPVLVTLDPDRVKVFNEALKQRVPGQPKAGSSSVIQVHCSLGLGLLLSKLYQEHFSELAGNEGYMMMTTSLDVLETAALSGDLENTEGASLGIGLALSSLCKENIVDSRVHLLAMHQKLKALLDNHSNESNQVLQMMSFSFSLVTANAYHTGIIIGEEAFQCVVILKDLAARNNEVVGVSLSLGLLLHALLIGGHTGISEAVKQQLEIWETWIGNKELTSPQRLAGVNGLMALLGSEQGFFQIDSTAADLEAVAQGKAMSILKTLKSFVSSPQDIGLASNIAWLLGHTYSAATSSPITKTSVPANYNYLPDTSVLRAVFDFLVAAGKTGPHLQFSSDVVNAVLIAMVTGPQVILPPVNWASVMGPIMRSAFGDETSRLCLQFAVNQAKSSSSLMSFLSSWLSTGLFIGLQPKCQKELYQSLSKLIFVVPSARVQEFLKGPVITGFNLVKDPCLCQAILSGLLSALQVKEPPVSVFGWTCTAVKQIYEALPLNSCLQHLDIIELLANSLAQSPLEQTDALTQTPNLKSAAIRCNLVGSGQAPIKWLNVCVTWLLDSTNQGDPESTYLTLWMTLKSLYKLKDSTQHKTDERLAWFLDVISQIRITATNNNQQLHESSDEPLRRGLALLSGIAMFFSGTNATLNMDSIFVTATQDSQSELINIKLNIEMIKENLNKLLRLLSCTLVDLMQLEHWKPITDKLLEWLLALQGSAGIQASANLKMIIEECIAAFRNTDPFKKISTWTEALARTHGIG